MKFGISPSGDLRGGYPASLLKEPRAMHCIVLAQVLCDQALACASFWQAVVSGSDTCAYGHAASVASISGLLLLPGSISSPGEGINLSLCKRTLQFPSTTPLCSPLTSLIAFLRSPREKVHLPQQRKSVIAPVRLPYRPLLPTVDTTSQTMPKLAA